MNKAFSEYLIQHLVNQGVLTWANDNSSWPAIVGTMPDNDDNPDSFVSILDSGAELDGVDHRNKVSVQHPTFQVFIRAEDYLDALKKGKEIESVLQSTHNVSVTVEGFGATINAVQIKIPTTFLKEQEKNRRQLFVLNIQSTLREV